MLNPAIGELIEAYDNRYQLVLDVAKFAREIAAEAEKRGEILVEKPVSLAINRLASKLKGGSSPISSDLSDFSFSSGLEDVSGAAQQVPDSQVAQNE